MSRTTQVAVFADNPILWQHTQLDLPSAPPLPPKQEHEESAATLFTSLVATVNEGDPEQGTASFAELDPDVGDLVKLCSYGAGLVQDQHL